MTDTGPTLLLTRPLAASEKLVQQLGARGVDLPAVISPTMEVVPVPFDAGVVDTDDLVFTSANAVKAVAGRMDLRGRRAWVVGPRTGEAARDAGMETVSAEGDANDLVALIGKARPGRLVHLHGVHTRGDVAARLTAAGVPTVSLVVYDQRPLPLSAEAIALLSGEAPVLVPLYSPRSARLLGQASGQIAAPCTIVAISRATAGAWPHEGKVIVCAAPNGQAMIDAIADAAAGSLVARHPSG